MAAHGKNLYFNLDNASGTPTDLSTHVSEVNIPETLDTSEVTAGGNGGNKSYLAGLGDGTISLSGPWSPTLDAHMTALLAAFKAGTVASASFEHGPTGNGSGARKKTGEAIVTSYEVDDSVQDAITWSAELQVTGGVTSGTFS